MRRPHAVALDMVETVFSMAPLAERLQAAGLPESTLRLFFAQMLRDAFALEASGVYKPFADVAAGSLAVTMSNHGVEQGKQAIESVLSAFAELPAHPDVANGLQLLRDAGIPAIALTNGSANNTRNLLVRSGLAHLVKLVISIDDVQRWKPNREIYLHAARCVGVDPDRLVLIAAHAWDVHGAKQAGLAGAWLRRLDRAYHPAMQPPDLRGDTLGEIVEALLKLTD